MSGNIYAALAVGGLDAMSTYQKLSAQKQALKEQAKLARQNATLADNEARDALDIGREDVTEYQRNLSGFKSSQINALAENGIDVSQGSAIDVLASSDMIGQNDIDNIKYNAALASWGHKVEQTNYLNQANSLDAQAKAVRPQFNSTMAFARGFFSAGGGNSLMSGGKK